MRPSGRDAQQQRARDRHSEPQKAAWSQPTASKTATMSSTRFRAGDPPHGECGRTHPCRVDQTKCGEQMTTSGQGTAPASVSPTSCRPEIRRSITSTSTAPSPTTWYANLGRHRLHGRSRYLGASGTPTSAPPRQATEHEPFRFTTHNALIEHRVRTCRPLRRDLPGPRPRVSPQGEASNAAGRDPHQGGSTCLRSRQRAGHFGCSLGRTTVWA